MRRILYVSTSTTLGGAEKTLYLLATCGLFKTTGVVSVKPFDDSYREKLAAAGVRDAFSLEAGPIPNPGSLRRLADIVRKTQPDIVHAMMYQAIQLSRAVKRFCGGAFRLVSSPRVNYRSRSLFSLCIDRLLKPADDLMICESEASRQYLTGHLGYPPSRTVTIHNGIEKLPEFRRDEARKNTRIKLGVKPDDVLIGAVGRLDLQKGHAYLLEALAKLKVLHPVRCVIVGDGPLGLELKKMAADLRIDTAVYFAGRQPDVFPWYAAMDIFVLPSLWEGLPNALLEAMAMGLPIVATAVDGVPEAVEHRQSGLLCEPRNSQALVSAIQEYIVKPGLRTSFGEAARSRTVRDFQIETMTAAYHDAYERVLRDRI